jgi:hypothetical protein
MPPTPRRPYWERFTFGLASLDGRNVRTFMNTGARLKIGETGVPISTTGHIIKFTDNFHFIISDHNNVPVISGSIDYSTGLNNVNSKYLRTDANEPIYYCPSNICRSRSRVSITRRNRTNNNE